MPTRLLACNMAEIIPSEWPPLLPHQTISLFYHSYVRLDAWYGHGHLTPLSRVVLISSVVGSAVVILHGPVHVKGRRRETVRAIALLATMLAALSTLIFLLPLSSSTALRERGDVAVVPNLRDPRAVDPQSVCPGYKAFNVAETPLGLTADLVLAGHYCNVYGTDVEALSLVVEYQAADRLHVEILPKYIGQGNQSWFILPDALVPKPKAEEDIKPQGDLDFSWSNEPTFSFTITRKSTGDVLFTTENSQIVYEDQFIEFGSTLPENYNLYGLGETIHSFRLGNNVTSTPWLSLVP
jgi:hypothetical protein